MYIRKYVYIYAYKSVLFVYVRTYLYTSVHLSVGMCTSTCNYMYICSSIYVCIYV